MRLTPLFIALTALSAPLAASAADWDNWPTKVAFSDGTELAATANIAYDLNDFSGADAFEDDDAVRRKEFGATLKKKGVYDAMVYYDFQADTWLDVFFRFESKAVFGKDIGRFRFGYMKTPVGLDSNTSSRAGSFVETALPVQAFYAGRRTGAEWVLERPQYLMQVGAYGGKDLQGDNPGTTQAVRGVWTPVKAPGDVIHLGLAYSQENPRGYRDGRDVHFNASARLRARPEAGLTDIRLVDSGSLVTADQIRRTGLEGIYIHGPFSVQAEALRTTVTRDGKPDYTGDGQYVMGSWIVTGESRPYSAGAVANVKPAHDYGAVELLARYSRIDLDDADVFGGRQHDWTVGANWYLTSHFKFQANYVWADASRRGVRTKPEIFELRAQVHF
ncbi:MAG: porin [Stenotrophomonas rhizophila]|jgi:phosphate-selective porin OprO/OprP|uniref:Phosphate-selective porin OprO/OprP n=1 Tax=Stenotrophomonas rhizophila TaxID=216778 RepID=A0AAP5E8X1_9GAMM|nr:porin [Stenotrophomonas rhizophila]MDF2818093.1 porin [Stenotrophomonas rhizophila]MDQ1107492.1 phosphate-selective porin OprO/OprP [Stenotrophomonas rhizophila]